MKTKNQIKKELSNQYMKIPSSEKERINEVILMLNVRAFKHNVSDPDFLIRQIKMLKGESLLEDWDAIVEDLELEKQKNPPIIKRDKDDILSGYDYVRGLIDQTKLAEVILFDNNDNLFQKINGHFDIKHVYHYVCYSIVNNYLVNSGSTISQFEKFSNYLLLQVEDLYPFIPVFEILDIDFDNASDFFQVRNYHNNVNILKELYPDNISFEQFFQDTMGQTVETYRQWIKELEEKRRIFEKERFDESRKYKKLL